MMTGLLARLLGRRGRRLALMVVVAGGAGAFATPAMASGPVLSITMAHANPYGAQADECGEKGSTKEGHAEPFATPPCGVDPFTEPVTGSVSQKEKEEGEKGETFAQESSTDSYTLTVHNTGTETTSPVQVVQRLPVGIVFGGNRENLTNEPGGWQCALVEEAFQAGLYEGPHEVKCTHAATLPTGAFSINLLVRTDPQAPVTSTTHKLSISKATVSGGGAPEASTTEEEGETTITAPVPFGIACFAVAAESVERLSHYYPCNKSAAGFEKGAPTPKPVTQAGGHPLAYTSEIVFNSTTNANPGTKNLTIASGASKDVEVDLPPGFFGNTQDTPRCPLELLAGDNCPANTAVGYSEVKLDGEILKGRPVPFFEDPVGVEVTSLIFNMQPTPGHPAELGFVVLHDLPILLEAEVRSDGDYGVTIGNSAGSNGTKIMAIKVTTCENGASGSPPNQHCNLVSVGSRSFLTNPTQCASSEPDQSAAPLTTVRANRWGIEPEEREYRSKSAYTGASPGVLAGLPSAESLLTGCSELQFKPEIDFEPSAPSEGGTHQADEPTGIAFNLKVPQASEVAKENGAKEIEGAPPATPELKNLEMTLPEGLTLSPSAAHGLKTCSNAEFWPPVSGSEPAERREPAVPAQCEEASQIGTVEVFTPVLSGAPTISGTTSKGSLLTCSQGMWTPEVPGHPTSFQYQWLRNGVSLGSEHGAQSTIYEVQEADNDKALQCQVTATNEGGKSVAVSVDAVGGSPASGPPFPPPSIAAPSGTPQPGHTLTCASGSWTGGAESFGYQWLRNGVSLGSEDGAQTTSYTVQPGDEGAVIQCQVTGKNTLGEAVADSAGVVIAPVPSPSPPLPGAAVQGQLFVGEPECGNAPHPEPCSPEYAEGKGGPEHNRSLFRLFLQVQDKPAGVILKLRGINRVNTATGQVTAVFPRQPQQPFELAAIKLKGGPTAPLANPQSCGEAVTKTDLTPWSASGLGGLTGTELITGTEDAHPEASYKVGEGEACPGVLPFSPSFNAGATITSAGASTGFSAAFGRNDREQDLSGVTVHMPLGLVGRIPAVKQCGEAQANAGTCGPESEIGIAKTLAGPGEDPYPETGHVYFTGPYKGAPFGLSVVTPADAGPFHLGNIVVRSAITINPFTAAVTTTSDPLPQIVDGVPIRLRSVDVEITKPGFLLNPTNCAGQQVTATLASAQSTEAQVSSPFGISGCKSLLFHPTFTATTQAYTSKTEGASLDVKITYPQGAYANIAKTVTELPTQLPSRLTTLQKACLVAVFEANPAACPEGSVVGTATARTPVLNVPLTGPAYLVSHGGAAFPDLEIVLQGENVTVVLDGQTDIKKGITKTTFNAVPDSPVSEFEVNLPEGPHSALAANVEPCKVALSLPTVLTGQNGAELKQTTPIAVTGCPPTVLVTKTKLSGNTLVVTVKTSAKGNVTISGKGLKTVTKKNLTAGTHQIRVALTKAGRSMRSHHKKISVRVGLTVGKQAVFKATTVRL